MPKNDANFQRPWQPLMRPARRLIMYFVEGDHEWADYRLATLVVVILTLAVIGRFWESVDPELMRQRVWEVNAFPVVGWVTSQLPPPVLAFLYAFFTRATLRYWVPPLLGVLLAFTVSALYLQDVFGLRRYWRDAVRYLFYSLFGQSYLALTVPEAAAADEAGEAHLLNVIGGPGYLDVKLGNAVLCERLAGPSAVYGAGRHFLRRFEKVRAVVSLEEQHRQSEKVEAVTKDGLPVTLRDVEVTFRVHAGKPRTPDNPYPFLPGAIPAIVYGQTVSEKGAGEWQGSVLGAVRGRIVNWIATQRLDDLTGPLRNPALFDKPAPRDDDPRRKIRGLFERPDVRQQFTGMGVELLWVSVGHIDSPPEVDAQRLYNWRAASEGDNSVTRAHAEAFDIQETMLARAKAQADTLIAIACALEEATAKNQPTTVHLHDLLILHMAQILEAMTAPPGLVDKTTAQLNSGPAPASNTPA